MGGIAGCDRSDHFSIWSRPVSRKSGSAQSGERRVVNMAGDDVLSSRV